MNIYRIIFLIGIFSVNSHLLFNFLSSMNPLHFCYLWKLLLNFIFIDFPRCIKWKLIDFSSKIDVAHWADAESKQHTWQLWRPRPSPVQRVVCCVHFPLMFSTSFLFFFLFFFAACQTLLRHVDFEAKSFRSGFSGRTLLLLHVINFADGQVALTSR